MSLILSLFPTEALKRAYQRSWTRELQREVVRGEL